MVPINGNSDEATSQYNLINEEAVFTVGTVRFDPAQPEVGQQMTLEVYLQNTGSLAGTVDLRVMGVYDGIASRETVHTSQELGIGATAWESITLEAYLTPTTGLYTSSMTRSAVNCSTTEVKPRAASSTSRSRATKAKAGPWPSCSSVWSVWSPCWPPCDGAPPPWRWRLGRGRR